MKKITDFTVKNLIDEPVDLSCYAGEVILIVNTASACGFTPQYAELQTLHEQYANQGLRIIAFPCNQFGAQEKGDATEIADFCDKNFHVTFPVMGKIKVNGHDAEPLWKDLKTKALVFWGLSASNGILLSFWWRVTALPYSDSRHRRNLCPWLSRLKWHWHTNSLSKIT